MESVKAFPVHMCKNGNLKDSRVVMITDWPSLMKEAKNKFRIKPKRIFTPEGNEILEADFSVSNPIIKEGLERNKLSLVVSDGSDFVGFKKEKKQTEAVGTFAEEQSNMKIVDNVVKEPIIKVLCNKTFVEEEAIKQLENTSKLPGMRYCCGMPDLHPGKGFPIGASCGSEGVFYPHLVGTDIGCGMSLWMTSLKRKRSQKVDKWSNMLYGLERGWEGDCQGFLEHRNVKPTEFDSNSLGTIGGGNHFAELQEVEQVLDEEKFKEIGLNEDFLYLLVHSGSRGYGAAILHEHLDKFDIRGIKENSIEAKDYLSKHDHAVEWARANRDLIALRFLSALQDPEIEPQAQEDKKHEVPAKKMLDITHNNVVQREFKLPKSSGSQEIEHVSLWLHRKGAAPSDVGPVVIPGSRGAFSYLVLPIDNPEKQQLSGFSLAHGAGRKWTRGKSVQVQGKEKSSLSVTSLGSIVICEDKDLLYEEQPDAYKDISDIITDLVEQGLVRIIAVLRPLITYKVRATNYGK